MFRKLFDRNTAYREQDRSTDVHQIRVSLSYVFELGHRVQRELLVKLMLATTVSERTTRWFHKLNSGDTNLKNDKRVRPKEMIENNESKARIEYDVCQSVCIRAEKLDVHYAMVSWHLRSVRKNEKVRQTSSA